MNLFNQDVVNTGLDAIVQPLIDLISSQSIDDKVETLNYIRQKLHQLSPFKNEPVDFVRWIKSDTVVANDYNPNKVAPPEMELLELSIINDGYTQPIVTWDSPEKQKVEVIDGFHRNRVGKESKVVSERILGYLPIVSIRKEQSDKNDRIASTIRHNRARGKHQVDAMSEIVIELKNRNWSNSRISKQLGMDEEEVLRLCQISGLEDLFSDSDFSNAWISEENQEVYTPITEDVNDEDMSAYRIPNESDTDRIFHTYDKWECYKAGFYENGLDGKTDEECEQLYINTLSDSDLFDSILSKVTTEWKYSCEHYLTNKYMNRIAWLGQASVCYHTGVPSKYSYAWFKIAEEKRDEANRIAHRHLNRWLNDHGQNDTELEEAMVIGRQMELY
jgi:ParB-like chromosome segregation protein Spo0J